MRWLIIGTGWISSDFVKNLKHVGEEVVAVYSRKQETGAAFAQEHDIPEVITSFDGHKDLFDAAYIGTPNIIHYDQAKTMILKGKHVMIEKPMTHSLKLTKELFDLAKENNVKIMEAYKHITNPITDHIKDVNLNTNFAKVSSKIKNGTWKSASSFSKKLFGGVVPDLGVYPMAMAIKINGPVIQWEITDYEIENNVEVTISATLKHSNHKITNFTVSKMKDLDNAVYADGKKIIDHISLGNEEWGMSEEIKLFISKEYSKYKYVSIEVARLVEEMKNFIFNK